MPPRVPLGLARPLILVYALLAVLGVDLVLCVDPGGHTAIEFGALECCGSAGPQVEAPENGPHPGDDDHGCGSCTDLELLPDAALQLRMPWVPARLALASLPVSTTDEASARGGRWAVVRATLPPPDDGRRGLVLRC